jgi:hypothetical protein
MITQNMYKCYHFSQSSYNFYVIIFPCTYFVLSFMLTHSEELCTGLRRTKFKL